MPEARLQRTREAYVYPRAVAKCNQCGRQFWVTLQDEHWQELFYCHPGSGCRAYLTHCDPGDER